MVLDDQGFNAQKERTERILDYWWSALGLQQTGWELQTQYFREEQKQRYEDGSVFVVWMTMVPSWQYQTCILKCYPSEYVHLDDAHLHQCVVHELMHMLVAEMHEDSDEDRSHEERVVTVLARRILFLHRQPSPLPTLESVAAGAGTPGPNSPTDATVPEGHPTAHQPPQPHTEPTPSVGGLVAGTIRALQRWTGSLRG